MSERTRNGWTQPEKIRITTEGRVYLDLLGYGNNLVPARGVSATVLVRPAAGSASQVDVFVPAERFRALSWNAPAPEVKDLRSGYLVPVRALWAADEHGQLSLRSTPPAQRGEPGTVAPEDRPQRLSDLVNGEADFTHYLTAQELVLGAGGQLLVRDYRVDAALAVAPEEEPTPAVHPVRLDFTLAGGSPQVSLELSFDALGAVPVVSEPGPVVEPQQITTTL